MTADFLKRYWVHTPELLAERMDETVSLYPDTIEPFELCRNNVGDIVPGFRMGTGPRHVFLLGREHGHEPVGPCGLTALMEGLASATVPGTGRPFLPAPDILRALTLHVFPLMNPDGARRFADQVPDSFPGIHFRYCEEDSEKYRRIHSEPGITLDKPRPPHYSPEDMEIWRKTGKPIGSLFTEDGVELWMDWEHDKAPQTRALKKRLSESSPSLFVDIHAWESPTTVLMPKSDEAGAHRHKALAGRIYDALADNDLPFREDHGIPEYGSPNVSIQWVHTTCGAVAFLYEIHNGYLWFRPEVHKPKDVTLPVLTQEQIIYSVWHGMAALLEALLDAENT